MDPSLSFVEAAVSLWEWEEGSSKENISLYCMTTKMYVDSNNQLNEPFLTRITHEFYACLGWVIPGGKGDVQPVRP